MIWRLKSAVRIPIAMSIKKLEKPVTAIFHSLRASLFGFTRRSVFFLLAKCVSITRNDTAESSAVARPAP